MKTLELASDVVTGASAFAAVIIVYVGSVATAYSSYDREAQRAVREKYRRRATIASVGVVLAAAAAGAALLGKWASSKGMVGFSACLMIVTLVWGAGTAIEIVREIR